MRGRLALAVVSLLGTAASVTACGGTSAQVFHPRGVIPASSAGLSPAGTARLTVAPGGYHFPAGVSVVFTANPPAGTLDRTVMTAYQDYVLALWAAVASHGGDSAYRQQAGGSALSFTQREVAYFSSGTRAVHGAVSYRDVTVAGVYYGTSATVTACVDASGFRVVNGRTGAVLGSVFPARYSHYLEDVTEGRQRGGSWLVDDTAAYPSATSQGAACR